MAGMVTKQELEAAKIDVKHAGEAVNEEKVVKTRLGRSFKSIPLIVKEGNQEIINLQNAIDIAAAAGAGENGWTAQLIVDESGKSQQEINNKTFDFIGKTVTPEMFGAKGDANYLDVNTGIWYKDAGKTQVCTDDYIALRDAILYAMENRAEIILDAKRYFCSQALPLIDAKPVTIRGKGQRQSWLIYGMTGVGALLSTIQQGWGSEPTQNDPNSDVINLTNDRTGSCFVGFSIAGDRRTPNIQHGLIHYNTTDNIHIDDFGVQNIRGTGWGCKPTDQWANVRLRESHIGHIYVRRCGHQASDTPAVHMLSTGTGSDDATNQVTIEKLDSTWPDGMAICIENAHDSQAIRQVRILSGQVHGREDSSSNPQTEPLVQIKGLVVACDVNLHENNGVRDGQYAYHITRHPDTLRSPKNIKLNGQVGAGPGGNGVWVEYGREIVLDLTSMITRNIDLKVGEGTSGNIYVKGSAQDIGFGGYDSWVIDGSDNAKRRIIFADRGGPFLLTKDSEGRILGGLYKDPSNPDGFVIASEDTNFITPHVRFSYVESLTSQKVTKNLFPRGISMSSSGDWADTDDPMQIKAETRGGVNAFIFQQTIAGTKKAITWNSVAPATGVWKQGDICFNALPVAGGNVGFVCVDATANLWRPFGQSGIASFTKANLSSLSDAVNTQGKFNGKQVRCTENNKLYYTLDSAANSPWYAVDGSETITLTVAETLTAGIVGYGIIGQDSSTFIESGRPRGQIRDTSADVSIVDGGYLPNWCVYCRKTF